MHPLSCPHLNQPSPPLPRPPHLPQTPSPSPAATTSSSARVSWPSWRAPPPCRCAFRPPAPPAAPASATSLHGAQPPPAAPCHLPHPPPPPPHHHNNTHITTRTPPPQGYNSGFSATASTDDDGALRQLSPDALSEEDAIAPLRAVDETMFNDGLGLAGRELLDQGVAGMVRDIQGVLPYFADMAVSAE
jgi:hypothetical protein